LSEGVKNQIIIDDIPNDITLDSKEGNDTILPEEEIKEEITIDNVQNDNL
jgi:hypothetical protein